MAELPTPTQKTVPSDDIRDHIYAGGMLDKVVTSTDLTYTDRLGGEHYTVDGIKAEGDKVVEETRQNLIPLSKQYMTLADAQADIANIPDGSTTYVRSTDGSTLADEYINNAGTLTATGRKMPSWGYVLSVLESIQRLFTALSITNNSLNNLSDSVFTYSQFTDTIIENFDKRSSGIYTGIAILSNIIQNISVSLEQNVQNIPTDMLNLLMLSSRLLKLLQPLEGFDPDAVLTKADIGDIGAGNHQTIDGIFSYPAPTSLITIDLTADRIPGSKDEGDVNATAVITLDGAVFSTRCKISVQGASSAAYPKKNLNLEFFDKNLESNVELKIGDLRPHDTWVYKANWVDSTQCRNVMSYRLWQAFQAARSGYPKFDIDATYVGKKGVSGFPTGATAVPVGYPCVMHINGVFYGLGSFLIGKKRGNYNLPKDSPLQIQLDIGQWIHLDEMEANKDNLNNLEFKAPKTVTDDTVAALQRWDAFVRLDAAGFAEEVGQKLDKNNIIDFYIFITFIAAADLIHNVEGNRIKNVQLVTWDGDKWFFMPYDLDTVFGNNWTGGYSYAPGNNIPWCAGTFWDNVRSTFGDEIRARYRELRDKGVISAEWIYDTVTTIQEKYPADAFESEIAKWGSTTPSLPYYANNGRDQIVTWTTARISALDSYFNYS